MPNISENILDGYITIDVSLLQYIYEFSKIVIIISEKENNKKLF